MYNGSMRIWDTVQWKQGDHIRAGYRSCSIRYSCTREAPKGLATIVDAVKQYDKHEAEVLQAIVDGRSKTADIENVTTSIAAVAEAYPELKSNENISS